MSISFRERLANACGACSNAISSGFYSVVDTIVDFRKPITIILGPAAALLIVYSVGNDPQHVGNPKVVRMAGVLVWMALWWLTEAVPVPITSLLPLALFPMAGILYCDEVTKAYWNDTVVLYLGSFMVGLAIERWKVHRRLALKLLLGLNSHNKDPRLLLLGFIGCTGVLSMFMSNTATSIM